MRRLSVSKNVLLETLAGGFETGSLQIARDLPLRADLMAKTASFELASTAARNLVLQGGGKSHHADMAIALALGFFASENLTLGFVGEGRLDGWI